MKRLKVKTVADLMGVSEQFVRVGLPLGVFPWGYAVKMSSRWADWINPARFREVTGINYEGI